MFIKAAKEVRTVLPVLFYDTATMMVITENRTATGEAVTVYAQYVLFEIGGGERRY